MSGGEKLSFASRNLILPGGGIFINFESMILTFFTKCKFCIIFK